MSPSPGEVAGAGEVEFIPFHRGSLFGVPLPVVTALKQNKFLAPLAYRRFLTFGPNNLKDTLEPESETEILNISS
ncbi:MAG: hypothetical protein ABIP71_00690 [Verrucomicrobiota bacterium]